MIGSITLSGVGKAYRQYSTPSQRLVEWLAMGRVKRHRVRWVLRDLTLSRVGIEKAVGREKVGSVGHRNLQSLAKFEE